MSQERSLSLTCKFEVYTDAQWFSAILHATSYLQSANCQAE